MIGKTLEHYEITSLLGKGGMGEVYRAEDSKLGRDVAIKILPTELSHDPERAARFDREARTLASLQHPNVASIYGLETVEGIRFLVMELVEGEDLSERLLRGAIPTEEVVDIAFQLAEGISAAHTVGVMHRDLKPANIIISSEGKVKILDFGLARAYAADEGTDSDLHNSPTITAMTQAGVIIGTAAYMSPEQARGKHVDHRADIWSFGVVLFEMLAGQRLFDGETVSDTLAGVLRSEVPWDQLPKETPPTIRRLLERCLERDPSRRLQSIAEARIALEDLSAGRTDESIDHGVANTGSHNMRERLTWVIAVVVLIAALVATNVSRDSTPEPLLTQSTLSAPRRLEFCTRSTLRRKPRRATSCVSRDHPVGTMEMGESPRPYGVRDLAHDEARQLAECTLDGYPFWSPDGKWIGYFSHGKLNKIEARGGPVIPLCTAKDGRGGTWNSEGSIVFQRSWSEGVDGGVSVPVAHPTR